MATGYLLTGDWQAVQGNLDDLSRLTDRMLDYGARNGVKHFIHLGDWKHTLNPADVRVLNHAVETVGRIRQAGLSVTVLRGNHDQLSSTAEADDWFPILEAAGAKVVNRPTRLQLSPFTFGFLPYTKDLKVSREAVSRWVASGCDILCFHQGVKKAWLNYGAASEEGLTLKDLQLPKFQWAFGAHYHMHQKLGSNGFYVGSPFCMDWGEANQTKGFMFLNKEGPRFVETGFARWFRVGAPGFDARQVVPGSKVLASVDVEAHGDISGQLRKVEEATQEAFPGCDVVVRVGRIKNAETEPTELTDEKALSRWLSQNLPQTLADRLPQIEAYCGAVLENVGYHGLTPLKRRFLRLRADNVLSYHHLDIDFRRGGLVVVTGDSEDWPGRSNGVGKTNYLSMLNVALTGATLKGQKHDALINQHSKVSGCRLRLSAKVGGVKIRVSRRRRPASLRLWVGSKETTTGTGSGLTQKSLYQILGAGPLALQNGLYIDQQSLSVFLDGTDTSKKKVLAEFLQLQAFEEAAVVVKSHYRKAQAAVARLETELGFTRATIEELKGVLEQENTNRQVTLAKLRSKIKVTKSQITHAQTEWKGLRVSLLRLAKASETAEEVVGELRRKSVELHRQQSETEEKIKVASSDICPTCGRRKKRKSATRLQAKLESLRRRIETHLQTLEKAVLESSDAYGEHRRMSGKSQMLQAQIKTLENTLAEDRQNLREARQVPSDGTKVRLKKWVRHRRLTKLSLEAAKDYVCFLKFAVSAFGKDGLPASLIASVIPRLNTACRHFARLFTDEVIVPQFRMNGEEPVIDVENTQGGQNTFDQSQGEMRLCSLIVSFAVRSVLFPSNVLIIDEPGEGLDEPNAIAFARGLLKLKGEFETILVTSHNAHILAALSGESHLQIIKRNKISEVSIT